MIAGRPPRKAAITRIPGTNAIAAKTPAIAQKIHNRLRKFFSSQRSARVEISLVWHSKRYGSSDLLTLRRSPLIGPVGLDEKSRKRALRCAGNPAAVKQPEEKIRCTHEAREHGTNQRRSTLSGRGD